MSALSIADPALEQTKAALIAHARERCGVVLPCDTCGLFLYCHTPESFGRRKSMKKIIRLIKALFGKRTHSIEIRLDGKRIYSLKSS